MVLQNTILRFRKVVQCNGSYGKEEEEADGEREEDGVEDVVGEEEEEGEDEPISVSDILESQRDIDREEVSVLLRFCHVCMLYVLRFSHYECMVKYGNSYTSVLTFRDAPRKLQ